MARLPIIGVPETGVCRLTTIKTTERNLYEARRPVTDRFGHHDLLAGNTAYWAHSLRHVTNIAAIKLIATKLNGGYMVMTEYLSPDHNRCESLGESYLGQNA